MKKQRNIGLDLIRVCAMAFVWINHSGVFSLGLNPKVMEFGAVVALEIFFALSGFLVGKSLILTVTDNRPRKSMKKFYVNRLIRILPLYYLVLIYIAVTSGTKIPLSNLLFLQNLVPGGLDFFPPSWSLPVEVWFYFLIPPVFYCLVRVFSRNTDQKTAIFRAVAVLCLVPFALRTAHIVLNCPDWDYGVRKQVFLRMDALMLGVYFSGIKLYTPDRYKQLAGNPMTLLVAVAGITAVCGWYGMYLSEENIFNNSAAGKIVVFTALPVCCSLLVVWLENASVFERLRGTILEKAVCGISSLGYEIYLIHFSVFMALSPYFVGARFIVSWAGFAMSVALTIVISFAAYKLVNEPLARLKDKVTAKM